MEDKEIEIKWHRYLPKPHIEGLVFILIGAALTAFLGMFSYQVGIVFALLTVCVYLFFRDPERVTPKGDNLVISPADGVVNMIKTMKPPKELELPDEDMIRVSVFMSVFNVHVNRAPADGKIVKTFYVPGNFVNVGKPKDSDDNERKIIEMETAAGGKKLVFVQIAGLVARRIVCHLKDGQEVKKGERFGLIRFGSRLDVYMPTSADIKVECGQTMVAGETVIAEI